MSAESQIQAMVQFMIDQAPEGWAGCAQYCAPDATFACQSQALAETKTLEAYAEWMKGLLVPLPDGHYELKGFAADGGRDTVLAFAAFWAGAIVVHRRLTPTDAPKINVPLCFLTFNYGVLCYFTSGLEAPFVHLAAIGCALSVPLSISAMPANARRMAVR